METKTYRASCNRTDLREVIIYRDEDAGRCVIGRVVFALELGLQESVKQELRRGRGGISDQQYLSALGDSMPCLSALLLLPRGRER